MDRILVEILLPAAGRAFDVFIPAHSPLGEVAALAARALSSLARGCFLPDGQAMLFDADSGRALDAGKSAAQLGLSNGKQLIIT